MCCPSILRSSGLPADGDGCFVVDQHTDTAHPDDPAGTSAGPEAREREGSSSSTPRRESRRKGDRSHRHRHSGAEGGSSSRRRTPTKKTAAPSSQPRIVQAWRDIFGSKKPGRTHEARRPRQRSRTESSGGSQLKPTKSRASGSQENDSSARPLKEITKLGVCHHPSKSLNLGYILRV